MNKENKLCPFCKNKYLYVIGINNDMDCEQQKILCADCGATGPFADSPEEAWEKWNKRRVENDKHNS